jgi:hypothetical protein
MSAGPTAQPSAWTIERFGPALAAQLWQRVPCALGCAVNRARDAHDASQMTTNHAFGSARWPIQYEELVKHLDDLDGATTVRLRRTFYQLVIVGGHLILPWYYAQTPDVRMRDARLGHSFGLVAREIVARFGPPPHWTQLSLLPTDDEEEREVDEARSVLYRLDPPPKVLIVGYACNARHGLLGVWWGEAALGDDDELHWYHDEQLPIPAETAREAG